MGRRQVFPPTESTRWRWRNIKGRYIPLPLLQYYNTSRMYSPSFLSLSAKDGRSAPAWPILLDPQVLGSDGQGGEMGVVGKGSPAFCNWVTDLNWSSWLQALRMLRDKIMLLRLKNHIQTIFLFFIIYYYWRVRWAGEKYFLSQRVRWRWRKINGKYITLPLWQNYTIITHIGNVFPIVHVPFRKGWKVSSCLTHPDGSPPFTIHQLLLVPFTELDGLCMHPRVQHIVGVKQTEHNIPLHLMVNLLLEF